MSRGLQLARTSARAEARGARRPGFSLIELMIALTILGLGLVMVATLFPVAWTRARELSEYTTQAAVTENSGVTLDLLTAAAGNGTGFGSYAGDLFYDDALGTTFIEKLLFWPDSRIHALHLENILVVDRDFIPDREQHLTPADPRQSVGAPWRLEVMDDTGAGGSNWPNYIFERAFGRAQLRVEQRVYPPLRPPHIEGKESKDLFDDPSSDPTWLESLDGRRFAVAILHRLREPSVDEESLSEYWKNLQNVPEVIDAASAPRVFDIYYVTLRRTQPTHRYAQQDPDIDRVPFPAANAVAPRRGDPVTPEALASDYDVMFPVPWRVQVYFPPGQLASVENPGAFMAPRGVPTEIEINTDNAPSADFVVDFFQPETPFIDEVNGRIYKVVRRRLGGSKLDEAYITIDREVLAEDLDDGYYNQDPTDNHFKNWKIEDDEALRTVWVFPPPVQAVRLGSTPVFEGKQPVVGIDVRTVTVAP